MIIPNKINRKELYRYLGYKGNTPDVSTEKLVDNAEKELLSTIKPRYIYRLFSLKKIQGEESCVQLDGGKLCLPGKEIRNHLEECSQVALMAATLSADTDRLLRRLQIDDMATATVANSAANTVIEQICDAVAEEIFQKTGLYQTYRFSPGYGDLPISIQKDFLNVLDAPRKIGLTVTPNDIMVPEKSVSAIIGLSAEPIQKKRRGCRFCNLRKSCSFRLQGAHCGY